MLAGLVARLAKDYLTQLKAGKEPIFDPSTMPEIAKQIDRTIWDEKLKR